MRSPASSESTIVAVRGAACGSVRRPSTRPSPPPSSRVGGKVKVLEANKIRRGGIGGFFASDLGVEVTVVPEEGSVDDILERLIAGTTDELAFDAAPSGTAELASLVATSDRATTDVTASSRPPSRRTPTTTTSTCSTRPRCRCASCARWST